MKLIKNIFKLIGFIIKLVFETVVLLTLIGICLFVYARFIEPELITVREEVIKTSTLKHMERPIKIIQFSDTHLGPDFTLENLNKVIQKVNAADPDVIVFTGDLIDNNRELDDTAAVVKALEILEAKLCKVAVYGNHDHGGNGTRKYKKIMEESGFVLLNNSHYIVDLGQNQKMNIMGIDDLLLGRPDVKKAVKGISEKHFNLFISHAPDIADELAAYPIDLQLSGHSHGGQVSIPFLGAPFTPPYARNYIKGMYGAKGNERMKIYVNPGLGTSQLKYRFLNVPEITVFTIQPE